MKRQLVTFRVGDQTFGLDILFVREINRPLECTAVQLAEEYYIGLANLRGQLVAVMDLAKRLRMSTGSREPERHDIILKADAELETIRTREHRPDLRASPDPMGLRVDDIGDIVEVPLAHVEPAPANLAGISAEFVSGVAVVPEGLIVLLDAMELSSLVEPGGLSPQEQQ